MSRYFFEYEQTIIIVCLKKVQIVFKLKSKMLTSFFPIYHFWLHHRLFIIFLKYLQTFPETSPIHYSERQYLLTKLKINKLQTFTLTIHTTNFSRLYLRKCWEAPNKALTQGWFRILRSKKCLLTMNGRPSLAFILRHSYDGSYNKVISGAQITKTSKGTSRIFRRARMDIGEKWPSPEGQNLGPVFVTGKTSHLRNQRLINFDKSCPKAKVDPKYFRWNRINLSFLYVWISYLNKFWFYNIRKYIKVMFEYLKYCMIDYIIRKSYDEQKI